MKIMGITHDYMYECGVTWLVHTDLAVLNKLADKHDNKGKVSIWTGEGWKPIWKDGEMIHANSSGYHAGRNTVNEHEQR